MTWCYSVPRVISALSSTPVPVNTDMISEGGNKVKINLVTQVENLDIQVVYSCKKVPPQ